MTSLYWTMVYEVDRSSASPAVLQEHKDDWVEVLGMLTSNSTNNATGVMKCASHFLDIVRCLL